MKYNPFVELFLKKTCQSSNEFNHLQRKKVKLPKNVRNYPITYVFQDELRDKAI